MDYFHTITDWLTDLVFPARCAGCAAIGHHLCRTCSDAFPMRTRQECVVCTLETPTGQPCQRCQPHTMMDRLLIAGVADNPLLTQAIYAFKYRSIAGLAGPLAQWLTDALALRQITRAPFYANPLLTCVPLHPRRVRERGFNQSDLLARHVAATVAMPYESGVLERMRHTTSQVKTHSRWERLENMKEAFACTRPDLVVDKDIVLVDDVCTTGATLNGCAYALKACSARTVTAIVLMRG